MKSCSEGTGSRASCSVEWTWQQFAKEIREEIVVSTEDRMFERIGRERCAWDLGGAHGHPARAHFRQYRGVLQIMRLAEVSLRVPRHGS